jgi:GNAT superfamily N-acetyltransferase
VGVRRIAPTDVGTVTELVHELARYEKAADQCHLTPDQLSAALFGEHPHLFGHVAEQDGAVVGCALWFLNYSTWDGVHGIYLEDLFVRADHRGSGLGRALLVELAAECERQGYSRLQWCSTGTPRRSSSTGRSVPRRWTSGSSTASRAIRCARWPARPRGSDELRGPGPRCAVLGPASGLRWPHGVRSDGR